MIQTDQELQQPVAPVRVEVTPGVQLRRAREAQSLSKGEIARGLCITEYLVTALEKDQYEKLRGDTFIIGYLRNYAIRVGLPPEQLLSDYRAYRQQLEETLEQVRRPAVESESPEDDDESLPVWRQLIRFCGVKLCVLLAVLCWVIVYFYLQDGGSSAPGPTSESSQVQQADALALPVASAGMSVANNVIERRSPLPGRGEAAKPVVTAAGITLDVLQISFTDESWVEITDAKGDILATDLYQQGDQVTVHGRSPFSVTLGNPSSAHLAVNGNLLDYQGPERQGPVHTVIGMSWENATNQP